MLPTGEEAYCTSLNRFPDCSEHCIPFLGLWACYVHAAWFPCLRLVVAVFHAASFESITKDFITAIILPLTPPVQLMYDAELA